MYLGTAMFCLHLVFSTIIRLPYIWRLGRMRRRVDKGDISQGALYSYVHTVAQSWARAQLRWGGVRSTVTGLNFLADLPKGRPVVFVGNHQSDFDVALYLNYISMPIGFVAKTVTAKIPIAAKAMAYMDCAFMNRDDPRQSVKTILNAIEIAKAGHAMVIFPEGTRRRQNPTGEFKAGALRLATKSNALLIPVTVDGSENIFELNHGHIAPAHVYITFHEPIDTALLSKEEQNNLHENVRAIIIGALKNPR